MALLQVHAVSKSFGAIHALTDVSFSVDAGEVVGFMGDNGAGKSTMVKLIAGNFPPTDGEVVVDGHVCHFHKPIEARAKGIEVVYQDLALADNLTAAQNVFLGRELNKGVWPFKILDKEAMIKRAAELFSELKSETRPRDLVKKMSGGQRQAVAIARTRLSNAKLVRAMATAWRWPPDIFFTRSRGRVSDLSSLKSSAARLIIASLSRILKGQTPLLISRPRKTFCAAVRLSASARSW